MSYFGTIRQLVTETDLRLLRESNEGGPGSGFEDHKGRPGEVGGSAPEKGGKVISRDDYRRMSKEEKVERVKDVARRITTRDRKSRGPGWPIFREYVLPAEFSEDRKSENPPLAIINAVTGGAAVTITGMNLRHEGTGVGQAIYYRMLLDGLKIDPTDEATPEAVRARNALARKGLAVEDSRGYLTLNKEK